MRLCGTVQVRFRFNNRLVIKLCGSVTWTVGNRKAPLLHHEYTYIWDHTFFLISRRCAVWIGNFCSWDANTPSPNTTCCVAPTVSGIFMGNFDSTTSFWPLGVTACCEGGSSTSGCVGGVEHNLVFTASKLSLPCSIAGWIIVGTHKVSGLLFETTLYGWMRDCNPFHLRFFCWPLAACVIVDATYIVSPHKLHSCSYMHVTWCPCTISTDMAWPKGHAVEGIGEMGHPKLV
jgi:hypothetical protein